MRKLGWGAMVALAMALGAAAQAQPVYKWVHADGKTHYGSQPPSTSQDAEPMKLQNNNGPSGSGGACSKGSASSAGRSAGAPPFNPAGPKKIPKGVKAFGEGPQKGPARG